LRKLDELMWMFLRLLRTEQSLQTFLAAEQNEDLGAAVIAAESELTALRSEISREKEKGMSGESSKERLADSRSERLEVLRKRLMRREESRANLALILAEEERLTEQIKLIRADAVATRNAEALSARIDASVAHLNETNKWLSELDEFKELVGDLPQTDQRIGFAPAVAVPPLPTGAGVPTPSSERREPPRQRDRA
jgi:predicted RNase H-like nuclease (RuvC/YqgF family)